MGEFTRSTRLSPADLDDLPVGTFLILSTSQGAPVVAMRLVEPNHPEHYPWALRTPGNRLLYYFWRGAPKSEAVKRLGQASTAKRWRWIIEPHQSGYEMLEAFKIVCDARHGKEVSRKLLHDALGYVPSPNVSDLWIAHDELT